METNLSKNKNVLTIVLAISFFFSFCYIGSAQNGVGINTTNPQSNFEVNGSIGQTVTTVTASTTLTATQSIIICNNGATAITITLPAVASCSGRIYTIKKNATSTANITISGTIDGVTNLVLKNAGEASTLFSNGTEWKTMSNYNSPSSWSIKGNTGSDSTTNFMGTTDAVALVVKTNNTERLRVLSNGNIGIGVTSPTAYLQLKAGTTASGTAPLKFSDGPLMTTVEPGAIEYKGHTFYATTYLVRRSVMLAQDVVVTPVTVGNTTTETTIYTSTMAANYLTDGKLINIKLYGRFYTNGGSNDIYTFRVKLAGTTVLTVTSVQQNANNRPFDIDIRSTVRSIGANGSIMSYGKTQQDNQTPNIEIGTLTTINTTVLNTMTITVQWNNASAGNTLTLEGGATECVDPNN